jgi:hypothetical protein
MIDAHLDAITACLLARRLSNKTVESIHYWLEQLPMRLIAPLWGLVGIFLLLGFAVYRLTPKAIEAIQMGLSPGQWSVLVLWTVFMGVAEGYRGFQKRFSPRTAARAAYLRDQPSAMRAILAPFFCMGYFHASRRVQIASISLTLAIIAIIVLVSFCSQPWRGIIDFGVVVGLTWGMVSLAAYSWKALTGTDFGHSPETP